MPTTVFFATNRDVTNPDDAIGGYPPRIVSPSSTDRMTYGTAFVDGVDVPSHAQGVVSQIAETNKGGFSPEDIGDLANAGRNLLVFVHGFDNTFSDAVTRAAYNREWIAASGLDGSATSVIAFSWPSLGLGRIFDLPIPSGDYHHDQQMARNSGFHLMSFLAVLQPILAAARANGRRSILLAHSMGLLALQAAVESWFLHGKGEAMMFHQAILAAGDCAYDTFEQPNLAALSGLSRLAERVSIYYSHADAVLKFAEVVNLGAQRLGQNGPRDRSDPARFPPAQYDMTDCTQYRDYGFNLLTSHQYYRESPSVRSIIAESMR